MGKYVLAYVGGTAPEGPEAEQQSMADWMGWFETIGPAIADAGNPFAAAATLTADGQQVAEGVSGLSGFSILNAESLDEALALAMSCPVLAVGGSVEVYETIDVQPPPQ